MILHFNDAAVEWERTFLTVNEEILQCGIDRFKLPGKNQYYSGLPETSCRPVRYVAG
jgi:hypothetical protein